MIFLKEDECGAGMSNPVSDELDKVLNKDPDTPEGIEAIASDVENIMMQSALESVVYFDGGEEALNNFMESGQLQKLDEARKMSKKTYVRLNKDDDLTRRAHLASIVIAKEKNDPLFHQLALNRVKERKLRNAIFKKYGNKAGLVAKRSQKQHIKAMRKMPALPMIKM
jgi:ribulose bisphosphate carboxylase small subunit